MSAAIKAVLATILAFVVILMLSYVELNYTHGALTVVGMVLCLVFSVFLLFYTIFND